MSTLYQPLPDVRFADVVDGRLAPLDVTVGVEKGPGNITLTDEANHLWAYECSDGTAYFERFGSNDVDRIVSVIEEVFGVEMVDEHDDRFEELFFDGEDRS